MDPDSIWCLIKKGNKSSAAAAIGNSFIAVCKGIAAGVSGSGAMFATTMHSVADALNQGFVFVGSVLAEKKPTRRFPTGFGRVVNIFCMIAVIIVAMLAYQTIKEGIHLIQHPAEMGGLWLNIFVLFINITIDGAILVKAIKEINRESQAGAKGIGMFFSAFRNVGKAAPPTRLVFYEDFVAVMGALLALVAVLVTSITNFAILDGMTTIIIGILMVFVAFRVGKENMVGLIGVSAPTDIEDKIAKLILSDRDVMDICEIRVIQEGQYYHVDGLIELKRGLLLANADHIKLRVRNKLLADPRIQDVLLDIREDNGIEDWQPQNLIVAK